MSDPCELFRLDGLTALVTGAASGLGREISCGFAEAGAQVVAADRNADRLAAVVGRTSTMRAIRLDVTDAAAVDAALGRLDRLDVVVNSAGVSGSCPAVEHPQNEWEGLLATNLTGTFHVCRAAGRLMLAAHSGSVVNMASDLGLVGAPEMAAYAASKGGVVQLTRSLAVEWAKSGVRVIALAPSTFETELVRRERALKPDRFERYLAMTPLGRFGNPAEIVGPALFLASSASSMVTGHILSVDGGYLAQ